MRIINTQKEFKEGSTVRKGFLDRIWTDTGTIWHVETVRTGVTWSARTGYFHEESRVRENSD